MFFLYLQTSTDPVIQKLYKKKISPPGKKPSFFSIQKGMEKVRKGLFAFFMDTLSAYTTISNTFEEHEKCGLQEIQTMSKTTLSLPIPKKSPYREIVATR